MIQFKTAHELCQFAPGLELQQMREGKYPRMGASDQDQELL